MINWLLISACSELCRAIVDTCDLSDNWSEARGDRASSTRRRRHCTMGLSPLNICIREIWPFAPIFQGNNCFRVKYLKITFTFNIYLGTSWKEAKSAKKSIEILTGWWKVVFQIFGTSWMLYGPVVWVNENIWEIFAPWRGQLPKKLLWSLWLQSNFFGSLIGLFACFQLW